ncbi:hypothetical protein ACIBSV_03370 [Embleya sp. NPDC050154]|uniref:hypothetical protein n=1 Tax=Embleya sp. NPDC050154 TaxID=3363988 RepID=UPI0037B34D9E
MINRRSYPTPPPPAWQPPSPSPVPVPVRPHGAWYLAPLVSAGLSGLSAVVAGAVWFGVRVRKSMVDTTEFGDGATVPSYPWNDRQGTVDLLLSLSVLTAALTVAGFVGLTIVRRRDRRDPTRDTPARG